MLSEVSYCILGGMEYGVEESKFRRGWAEVSARWAEEAESSAKLRRGGSCGIIGDFTDQKNYFTEF